MYIFCFEAFRGSRGLIRGGQTTPDPPPLYFTQWWQHMAGPCLSSSTETSPVTDMTAPLWSRRTTPQCRPTCSAAGTICAFLPADVRPVGSLSIPSEKTRRAKCRLKRPLVALLSPGALSGKKLIELARRGNYSTNGNNCVLQPASSACASHTRTPFICPFETSLETTHSTGSYKDKCGRLAHTKRLGAGGRPMYAKVNKFLFDPHTFPHPVWII